MIMGEEKRVESENCSGFGQLKWIFAISLAIFISRCAQQYSSSLCQAVYQNRFLLLEIEKGNSNTKTTCKDAL
jgi:hypothetical protein